MHTRSFLQVVVVILSIAAFIGCSSNDSPMEVSNDPGQSEELDLESSFGGYTKTDDAVAFDDSELLESEDDGIEAEDIMEDDPDVIDLGSRETTDIYSVRLAWGKLEGDSSSTDLVDWTGSITLSQDGAIVVERILRFERGDYIVRPRTERKLVELVSHTGPHWDGLLLTIFDPQDLLTDEKASVVNELTIKLGEFEVSYLLTDLDSLDEVIDVDDFGNQFSISTFMVEDFCPRGWIAGRWTHTAANRGVFRGHWRSRYGLSHGWLKGHFGVNDNGRKVFFGKYIGQNGEFRGLLRGHWDVAGDRPGGWFAGRWHGRNEIMGALRGVWSSRTDRATDMDNSTDESTLTDRGHGGFFHGEWKARCSDLLDDDFDSGSDDISDDTEPDEDEPLEDEV